MCRVDSSKFLSLPGPWGPGGSFVAFKVSVKVQGPIEWLCYVKSIQSSFEGQKRVSPQATT